MWDELVSTAIRGTAAQAAPVSGESQYLSALLENLNPGDREAGLLAAAGVTALWRLAGTRLPGDSKPLPSPAEPESAAVLGPRANQYLQRMLNGQYQEVLPEFLESIAPAEKLVPPELLPDLLDVARGSAELRPALPRVVGCRGQWLAAQNPLWRNLTAIPDEAAWEIGKSGERAALLAHLRATDPGRAIELLKSTWNQESTKDRPVFLEVLSTGLCPEDEHFLEAVLSDSRIEVRRIATILLARLPQSRLAVEVRSILFSAVEIKSRLLGKDRLEVTLHDELPKKLKAARIELESVPNRGGFKTLGEKAKLLYQLVAVTPPAAWTERFERTPERLIESARESDWSTALLAGWTATLGHYPEVDWTRALIRLYLPPSSPEAGLVAFPANAIRALPRDAAEGLIAEVLGHGTLAGDHPALWLISAYPGPWSQGLSRAIIKAAQRHISPLETYQATIIDALGQCALKMPPRLATEFASGWGIESGAPDRVVKLIDEFLSLLTFRRDTLGSISAED